MLESLVAKHRGRIFKVTGDGVLVEFGSAINAVQCAVDLQSAMSAANDGLQEDRHVASIYWTLPFAKRLPNTSAGPSNTRRWCRFTGIRDTRP